MTRVPKKLEALMVSGAAGGRVAGHARAGRGEGRRAGGALKVNVPGGEKRLPCAKAGATLTPATRARPARMEVILFMLVFPVSLIRDLMLLCSAVRQEPQLRRTLNCGHTL